MIRPTPGPYEIVKSKYGVDRIPVAVLDNGQMGERSLMIVGAKSCDTEEEVYANALLFAAAPEIHKALFRCLQFLLDLDTGEWIKGDDVDSSGMRERAKELQRLAFKAIHKTKGG